MIIPKLYQSGNTDSPGAINYSKKNYLSNEFALQGTIVNRAWMSKGQWFFNISGVDWINAMYYVETSEPLLTRPMVLSYNEVYFIYLVNMWVFILYAQNIQNLWAFKYDSNWLKKSVEFLYTHVYGMCDKGIHKHTCTHTHSTHVHNSNQKRERM